MQRRTVRPPLRRQENAAANASIRIAPALSIWIIVVIIWIIIRLIIIRLGKAEAERAHMRPEPFLCPGRARRDREDPERDRGNREGGRAA
jgi:hypothetical protein